MKTPRARSKRHKGTALTKREIDVVRLVARGLRNLQIGKQLQITEGTVKIHLHNIYKKVRVPTRLMLAVYAHKKRLV
jgi:two-component system, NarL family, nitrate/nitrite response regulator NarL